MGWCVSEIGLQQSIAASFNPHVNIQVLGVELCHAEDSIGGVTAEEIGLVVGVGLVVCGDAQGR